MTVCDAIAGFVYGYLHIVGVCHGMCFIMVILSCGMRLLRLAVGLALLLAFYDNVFSCAFRSAACSDVCCYSNSSLFCGFVASQLSSPQSKETLNSRCAL